MKGKYLAKSKKKLPKGYMEKLQKQIAKDLEEKNFSSIEEMNKYIQEKYTDIEIPIDEKEPILKEKAQDLVYDAWELDDPKKIILLAEKALKMDENCADAYNLLAQYRSKTPAESLELYLKGIEAGKKTLGKDFEKYKGHFWGYHETRPFMRAMAGYADALWYIKERTKSIEILKEMLLLNPNDNQGIRQVLITRLLILNRLLEAEKLYEEYKEDPSAHFVYSKAYLYFNKRSKQLYADRVLKEAMEYNPYVPLYLFGLRDIPDHMPDYIGFGDENEAIVYADDAMELWAKNEKASKWFAGLHRKMKNELDILIEEREREMRDKRKI
jgi:tetratricopeptide (TPR) repeat protein